MKDILRKAISYVLVFTMIMTMTTVIAPVNVSAATVTLESDKATYLEGEDIVVTAAGGVSGAEKAWVGIYKKGEVPGDGPTSIYWYYLNNGTAASVSNKQIVLQDQTSNNRSLVAGDYEIHLFNDGGYEILKTIEITIYGNGSGDGTGEGDLVSISYKLDNNIDGFANGTVTIESTSDNIAGSDCVMYWADNNGAPLTEYTPLAKFRLTGKTTDHEMYDYTIIPEDAEKLIAYKSVSGKQTGEPVMTELPDGCNYVLDDDYNVEFQLISDIHIVAEENHIHNTHFKQMLEDVRKNSPDSIGIFVNGDIADNGTAEQYEKLVSLYNNANSDGKLPIVHLAIGNHDWMNGNPENQFQKYVKKLNSSLAAQPETVYYHEVVNGYNFIYLGGESAGGNANLSAEQLTWFDELMQEITAADPEKPVFVLLHQPLYDTVAGSLKGQGWHGVNNEQALRDVLKKYDQIIIAGGHSHWELDSEINMYPGDENMSVAVNTASVGYLWTSYNLIGGEHADGSNGYFVRVYDDKVVFLGRDIENQRFVSSGMFVVEKNHIDTPTDHYEIDIKNGKTKLDAEFADDNNVKFESSDVSIVKVSSLGTLTPVKEGTAQIKITAYATEKYVKNYKTVAVTVVDEPVTPDEPEPDKPDTPGTEDPAPHEHVLGDWYESIAPGCETKGVKERKCAGCEYKETKDIPATGHTWGEWDITESSCTEKGSKIRKCKNCTAEDTATVPVKGHDYAYLEDVKPTCTESGLTGGTWCKRCGDITVEQKTIDAAGHKYSEWIIEKHATCADSGIEYKECDACKKVVKQRVSATGHNYDVFTRVDEAASMIDSGKLGTYRYCTKCQDKTDAQLITSTPIRKIAPVKVAGKTYIYNGKTYIPDMVIKNSVGITLQDGQDYDISIMNSNGKTVKKPVAVGTYKVIISFKGYYEGAAEYTYKILPDGTVLKKLIPGKKKITVNWTKKTAQVSGYQIRYSTKQNMQGAKTVTVAKTGTTSKVIKKLKPKKKYYVQVRTYKTVNGTKYYSVWSAKKNINTK